MVNEIIDNRLRRIAHVLLLNTSFSNNIGLLNGKMGVAVFFFLFATITGNEMYQALGICLLFILCILSLTGQDVPQTVCSHYINPVRKISLWHLGKNNFEINRFLRSPSLFAKTDNQQS